MNASLKIPKLNLEGGLTTYFEQTHTFTFGTTFSYTIGGSQSTTATVLPCKLYKISEFYKKAILDIPYRGKIKFTNGDCNKHNGCRIYDMI